jgi:carbon-monoxide dehydrogenase small subunit
VLLDGAPARACLVLAVQCDGRRVVTVEGFAGADGLHPLQQAWMDCHAFQCGFCTPGFLAAGYDLLVERGAPSEAEVREALSGNLCRCTGYEPIIDGVLLAAQRLAGAPVPRPGCEARP